MLNEIDELPAQLLTAKTEDLYQLLGKPTLLHLEGEQSNPLFLCTLLHGNETTGFYALQRLLNQYKQKKLPRSLSIFIGNVKAAADGLRRLEQQVDFNRVWPGTHDDFLAEAHMMKNVSDIMRQKQTFASIDIHNNTGRNPHYGCINSLGKKYIALAGMFSNTVVYFTNPKGVQSAAFAEFCPSVTLECGRSGQMDGVDHALRFIETVMQLDDLPSQVPEHINLFHTVARVTIPEAYSFGFADDATINLHSEIEMYNFRELEAGTVFASVEPKSNAFLHAFIDDESDQGKEFFECRNNEIVLKKSVMPSMLTKDATVIRQDCLCYLMERMQFER
ncbi:MAG TPA: M14 family metallopeptidase [Gammaproteobacteria bacterium]